MKSLSLLRFVAAALSALPLFIASAIAQDPDAGASGHWEGAITLPATSLGIHVDLANDGGWSGTIDIPVQGLRGFELADVDVDGPAVTFKLPDIPGDPVFSGGLSESGDSIEGGFSQSGQTFPFRIERTGKTGRKGETPARGLPGEGFAGVWQGSLKVNLFELRLLFKLSENGAEVSGTIDSIDQGANDMPLSSGSSEGTEIELKIDSIGGSYVGRLSDDGSEIDGEWSQGGRLLPLVLKRLEAAPDLRRPQDPREPLPYISEDVVFTNEIDGLRLAGTLTRPMTQGPHPAVVLISGSGPQDRDESLVGHRPFLVLADHLTRNGIAVLRFDDRGQGGSTGDFSKALTTDFVTDALAAVDHLRSRPEIDNDRIGLIGHSEGGLVAPMAAVRSDDIAFIVLLAGVGVPMDELLVRQSEDLLKVMGGTGEIIAKQRGVQSRIFQLVRADGDAPDLEDRVRAIMEEMLSEVTPEQRQAMGVDDGRIDSQVGMVTSPWFRALLEIDPRPTLEKVKVPVLAINGEKDVQVAWDENLSSIKAALKKGGNTDVRVRSFPDLNHLFQTCETGAIAEYGTIEETFAPVALDEVSSWIRRMTGLE